MCEAIGEYFDVDVPDWTEDEFTLIFVRAFDMSVIGGGIIEERASALLVASAQSFNTKESAVYNLNL